MALSRSSGPLLSVILPSRKRFDFLLETIDSFIKKAANRSNVEILVKLDSDDTESISNIAKFPDSVKTLVYPRMRGYHDLHIFVNDLCKISTGDWVMLFNDDARMVTDNWDSILEKFDPWSVNPDFKGSDSVCLLNPGSPESNKTWVFPMIRRKGYEALGHYSLHPHNDTWLQYVYEPLKAKVDFPNIRMKHYNNDVCDDTRWSSVNAQATSMNNWNEEIYKQLREADTEVLHNLLMKGN